MPTLIRLFVVLLVLGGLAVGGMVGLSLAVKPREKDVTIRIPSRELVASPERAPIVKREINTSRTVAPTAEPAAPEPSAPAAEPAAPAGATEPNTGDVVTLNPGTE